MDSGIEAGWLEFVVLYGQDILLSQCLSSPRRIKRYTGQLLANTVKNLRGLVAICSIRWKRIHIAIMIILIDSCNGNKQTNCNLLFSKDFIFEKREQALWYYCRAQQIYIQNNQSLTLRFLLKYIKYIKS